MVWKWLETASQRTLSLGFFILIWVPLGWAQFNPPTEVENPIVEESDTQAHLEEVLASWWSEYLEAKQGGDLESQEKAYQNFRDLKQANQSEIFELGSYLFLKEGFADLEKGRYDIARKEFHQALELNPYLWPARMGLASIKKEQDSDYGRYIHLNYEGLTRAFNPKNSYFVFDGLLWFLRNFLRIIFAIFLSIVAIFLVKYGRSFYATTINAFEQRGFKPLYAELLTMVIAVLPLVLGLNVVLAAGLYLALLFPFLEGREKHVGIAAFIGWLMVPLVLFAMSNIYSSRANPTLQAHMSQYYQGDHAEQIKRLNKLKGSHELQNRTKMLLGKHFKASNQMHEAMEVYESVPSSSKYYHLAQLNRGNLHVLAKEYQQAISIYKGIQGDKDAKGLALYNLSVVKALLGSHEESETYRSQALEQAPHLVDQMGLFENADERFLIDGEANPVDRLGHALLGKGNPLKQSWFSRPDFLFMGLAGIVFLLLGWFFSRTRNMRAQAKPCNKCGRIFFLSDSPNSDWCTQCVSLYLRKEDLPSDAKINKAEQVKRYTKIKRWTLNILQCLVPGSKQLFRGQAWAGFATLSIWFVLVVLSIYPIDSIQHTFMHYFQWPSFWAMLTISVTVVYWLIFGLRGVWQED